MYTQILAQSDSGTSNGLPGFFSGLQIDTLWDFIVKISWMQAIFAVAFGIIYLIYGWRVFKALVVINMALLGVFIGKYLGEKIGSSIWGAIMGATILGVISWPFMKYAVSGLGAVAGAVVGAALWRTFGLPVDLLWSGALVGLIAGGFLAFSSFKMSIIFFTSLQGSAFLVIGVLALLHDYPNFGIQLSETIKSNIYLLPLLIVGPTFGGIIFQQYLLRHEEDWAMPE